MITTPRRRSSSVSHTEHSAVGDARRAQQVVVVDEPGVAVAVDGAAQRQLPPDERQVEGQPGVGSGGAAGPLLTVSQTLVPYPQQRPGYNGLI